MGVKKVAWKKRLKKSKKPIKPWLMDGKNIAGVGNIYASEALFKSKIHPDAPANLLTLPLDDKPLRSRGG